MYSYDDRVHTISVQVIDAQVYRKNYSRDDMMEAIELIQTEGCCLEEAARRTGVPRNTLRDNVEKYRKLGSNAVMPPLGRRQVG